MGKQNIAILVTVLAVSWWGDVRGAPFVRGDADASSSINITDPIRILRFLFREVQPSVGCEDALDVNDDGALNLTDAIALLNYLFRRGPSPAEPHAGCGDDSTEDGLTCERFEPCVVSGGFFFVIDRSGSSLQGELQFSKRETIRAISEFPSTVVFAVIFSDLGVRDFPGGGNPARATPEVKEAAIAWISAVPSGSGSCPRGALLTALLYVDRSGAEENVITYLGDGGVTCRGQRPEEYVPRAIAIVTAANAGRARINVIAVGNNPNEEFLKALAAANGGTYTRDGPR